MLNWRKDSQQERSNADPEGSPTPEPSTGAAVAGPSSKPVSTSLRNPRGTLGAILVEEGIVTQNQLEEALKVKQERGGFLGKILVDLRYLDQNTLVSFLVKQCKIPHISLVDYEITGDLFKFVSKETCAQYNLLPIDKLGKILTVAMVDPLDIEALEHIRAACPDLKIKPILCDWDHFDSVAHRLLAIEPSGEEELTAASFGLRAGPGQARPSAKIEKAQPSPKGQAVEEGELLAVVEALEEENQTEAPSAETTHPAESRQPADASDASAPGYVGQGSSVEPFPLSKTKRDKDRASKAEQDVLDAIEGPGLRSRSDDRVRALLDTERPLDQYGFAGFFAGPENAFTLSLAKAVSEAPGKEYNPFYLCSGTGLGKTHLVNAMGNAIRKAHPDLRVGYVSATRFCQHVAEAAGQNKLDSFRDRYCRWDILLLDDLHYLEGRRQAQEELLHLFDAFCQEGRQLVMAGDRPPSEMPELDRPLASRFSGGIVASLRPPEYDTRMRILQNLTHGANVQIPDDILGTIAGRVPDDIRRMSGALRKVIAFARLVGQDITKDLVNEILSHLGVGEAA